MCVQVSVLKWVYVQVGVCSSGWVFKWLFVHMRFCSHFDIFLYLGRFLGRWFGASLLLLSFRRRFRPPSLPACFSHIISHHSTWQHNEKSQISNTVHEEPEMKHLRRCNAVLSWQERESMGMHNGIIDCFELSLRFVGFSPTHTLRNRYDLYPYYLILYPY